MMEYYTLVKNFAFTGEVGMYTYWLPLVLCAIGYTARTWQQVQQLKAPRETSHWVPNLTIGTILWRVILTVTPIVNVIALVFGVLDDMLRTVFSWIGDVLDYELVKK